MVNGHEQVLKKIKEKFKDKTLKVAYIRLGSGRENQEHFIRNKQFYIGYGSDDKKILDELISRKLSSDEFREFIRKDGDKNHHGPNAMTAVYDDIGNTLWYTILRGTLYFGFTNPDMKFEQFEKSGCVREMLYGWFNLDSKGEPISKRSVSGKVTKTAKIQGTISEKKDIKEIELLVMRILNQETKEKRFVKKCLARLPQKIEQLITQLDESDFELLVESLFLEQGYKKIAKSSGNEESYDLSLERPFDLVCKLPTFVQIKSAINKKVYEKVLIDFKKDFQFGGYHRDGFLCYHSGNYSPPNEIGHESNPYKKTLHLVGVDSIAIQVIKFGKIGWLLERTI